CFGPHYFAPGPFWSACGSGGYAQSLEDLSKPAMGSTVGFVQEPYTVNGVVQNGYTASLMAANGAGVILSKNLTCNGSAGDAMSGFVGERHAVTIGTTGARSFAI